MDPGAPVVALVASVGGLEAMTSVLGPLEPPFGAPIIVLIHQAPDQTSRLPEILASRSALPVAHARHGEPLEPDRILVAPPGAHLLVTNESRVALVASGAFPPNRPSADLLMASMGLTLGPRAIAVVLSGSGHDGATGASIVHDFGGTVLAADEDSSRAYGMPGAALERDHAVDESLPVEAIAARLEALVTECRERSG
jgi:two-component system, chemotaxis family, protein-glutamate methylesterase/glutaminase